MATRNFKKSPSDSHEPKAVGAILDEMLRSDSRFAAAYRRYKEAVDDEAEVETNQLFKNFFPDTHLNVDLKLVTREQGRIPVGAYLDGAITRDGENHFSFFQNDAEKKRLVVKQRNPHVFDGEYITLTRRDDGSLRPNFKPMPKLGANLSVDNYAFEVYCELRGALKGLVEE